MYLLSLHNMFFLQTIPADIWITIFECIEEPVHLAQVILTCSKFRQLATKILLKYLLWTKDDSTRRNLEDWDTIHQDLHCLPRRLKLGISFDGFIFSGSATEVSKHHTPPMVNDTNYPTVACFKQAIQYSRPTNVQVFDA